MTGIEIGLLALLVLGNKTAKGFAATRPTVKAWLARATQKRAMDWFPLFKNFGMSDTLAWALCRWAGVESSGNPLALSPIGERGLLQCTGTTRKGIYDDKAWAAMRNPETTNQEHAALAIKLYETMAKRALAHVQNPPKDETSIVWYAKMQHARPKDMTDIKMHGPALLMARDLATRWKNDPAKMGRLYSANVIAFGKTAP